MIWLLTRLYRRAVVAWIAISAFAALALIVIWWWEHGSLTTPGLHQCLSSLGSCTLSDLAMVSRLNSLNSLIGWGMIAVPLLMGVFIGAPLMGQELETKTHRLVWMQGVTPLRWLWSRVATAVGLCLFVGAIIGIAVATWLATLSGIEGAWRWRQFDSYLPVFEANIVFGVALGLAVATITRRTVPAMAITALLWVPVRALFVIFVRPMLLDPLVRPGMTANNAGQDWYQGMAYVDSNGHQVSISEVNQLLQQWGGQDANAVLREHGIVLAGLYQPASRFWELQGIESALFIAGGVVCLCLAAIWVRWRLERE